MVVTYSIPTDNSQNIILHSDGNFFADYEHGYSMPYYSSTRYDVFSDAIILSEINYYNKNSSLLENAMAVFGCRDYESFKKYMAGDESVIDDYPRYWHGNLVVLKPLFLFLNFNAVKLLELFFELVMVASIVNLMFKRGLKKYIVPFLFSLFLIHPEVIALCFQFSTMFNIMLISIFLLLRFKEILFKNNRLFYYFLIVGMASSFFDLLTYPLISFGVPMVFYILLEKDNPTLKENIIKILLFGCVWSIGYIGMWVSKWIISSVILNENVVSDGLNALLFRTSNEGVSRLDAIWANLLVYKKRSYLIVFCLMGIYFVKRLIDNREIITKDRLIQSISLLLIALIPFVWYLLTSNHSYIHFWFTYRELIIFFFAIMCSLEFIISNGDKIEVS